jgi:hypothetical protein
MNVDLGKDGGDVVSAFSVQFRNTVSDICTRFIEDVQDVKSGTTAHAH